MRTAATLLTAAAMTGAIPAAAHAQAGDTGKPTDAQSVVVLPVEQPSAVSSLAERAVTMPSFPQAGRWVHNVTVPTLTVFKPLNPAIDRKTAVIVAPGGGWRWLTIDGEGYNVARRLTARGFTAIVLKYRLKKTPDADEAFISDAMNFAVHLPSSAPDAEALMPNMEAKADGISAVRYVRAHAAELGIMPNRVGFIGFSAGGAPAAAAATSAKETRPDFFGLIYGAASTKIWPAETPPAFVAAAADDPLLKSVIAPGYEGLIRAGVSTELHIYRAGKHGFVSGTTGTSADLWFDQFCMWATTSGF